MKNIRRIKVCLLVHTLRVVVAPLQDRASPLRQQTFRLALNARFWSLALGVKDNDLANTTGDQSFLVDRQLRQRVHEVALNIVCWQRSVVQRLQEELYRLEKVDLGVNQTVDILIAVQERHHFREHPELVHRRLTLPAVNGVQLGCLCHALADILDLSIGHLFQVLQRLISTHRLYMSVPEALTMPSALRALLLVGFFSASSIARSRARRRPVQRPSVTVDPNPSNTRETHS